VKIVSTELPHREQRYDTVGDYQVEQSEFSNEEIWRFKISRTGDWRASAAIFLHEYIEAMLTKARGISVERIDEWDARKTTLTKTQEPGDQPGCPYRLEHRFAENLERLFVAELGLTWQEYEEEIERASKGT
jgi:hypothetical protein